MVITGLGEGRRGVCVTKERSCREGMVLCREDGSDEEISKGRREGCVRPMKGNE